MATNAIASTPTSRRRLFTSPRLSDLVAAIWQGRGPNPWPATGLEWQTPSPPPEENFHVTPQVTWEPYDFLNRPDLGLEAASAPALAPAHGDD